MNFFLWKLQLSEIKKGLIRFPVFKSPVFVVLNQPTLSNSLSFLTTTTTMADSPLQKLNKKTAGKKKLSVSLKKKRAPRPKPKTEAEVRLELTELKELVKAQLVASNRATKEAVVFLDKLASLEETTQNLEKCIRKNNRRLKINHRSPGNGNPTKSK